MTLRDYVSRLFPALLKKTSILKTDSYIGWEGLTCLPFGELVFRNIVELLTDLANDVTWVHIDKSDALTFARFTAFFEAEAKTVLWRVYRNGFAVIGLNKERGDFRLLNADEYVTVTTASVTAVKAKDPDLFCYVMKSPVWMEEQNSDWMLCRPFIEFLDNTLNASNTACAKMGAFVVASPETPSGAPTAVTLQPDDKKDLEQTISKEYGLLNKQRQVMLLPRGMRFETISLTGIDTKMNDRVRLCVCAIADRIKVPANQIAIIDATSSKTLANGTELREGDFNKYQSFERLLNRTFALFARDLGLNVTYTIYNKPDRNTTTAVEQITDPQ